MTDKPFSFWSDEWMTFQRNYMDALNAFNPQQNRSGQDEAPAVQTMNAWTQALDNWWKTMSSGVNPPARDFYNRFIDQGRAYFEMTEQLNSAFRASADAGQSALRWREAMEKTLASMKQAFSDGGGRQGDRKATAVWELPLENWQRMVSSMSVLPGDILRGVNIPGGGPLGFGPMEDLQQRLDEFLATPAVGHLRERQEQSQDLARLLLEYQQAVQEYAQALSQIGLKCIERTQMRLAEKTEADEPLASMRAVYDFWVDSCEEAYAEYVTSDEYIAIHGRLVNSLMALKQHGQTLVDEVLEALDMPTRQEIDSMHRRFQQLRREEHAVRAELNALRERLADGDRGEASPAERPAPKKAAPKKATPKKTAPAKRATARRRSTSKQSAPRQSTPKQSTNKAAPKKKRSRPRRG